MYIFELGSERVNQDVAAPAKYNRHCVWCCMGCQLCLTFPLLRFSFEDIASLSGSSSLSELSLDGNPFASDVTYKQTVLKNVCTLRQLDMKRISVSVYYSNRPADYNVTFLMKKGE